jgi:DNA-directed RNA polymerase subunit RPC12/RpoP
MAPTAKRRRLTERFRCYICLEDCPSKQFPIYNPTETCKHLINICMSCLKQWVESRIEATIFTPQIQCPQCDQKMNSRDIAMVVSKSMFTRYVFVH